MGKKGDQRKEHKGRSDFFFFVITEAISGVEGYIESKEHIEEKYPEQEKQHWQKC